jgi:hypothetical protein
MPTKDEAMDQHIADDLRVLIGSLSALGFAPRKYEYLSGSFGNYFIDFESGTFKFRIVRDRSQYFVEGEKDELESAGLWRVFGDKTVFGQAVLEWVKGKA